MTEPTTAAAALDALLVKVDELAERKYRLARMREPIASKITDAYVTCRAAVREAALAYGREVAAAIPCYGAHPHDAGYLRCEEYRDVQTTDEDRAWAESGFCLTCKARAELRRARSG